MILQEYLKEDSKFLMIQERGQGPGEIVVKKSYFDKNLATFFEFPRNFQASLIKEKELDEHAKNAIKKDGAFFVPFQQLPNWQGKC